MPRPGTRIIDYTDQELKDAIAETKAEIGEDAFYTILKGIDAYFEQRRRKFPSEYNTSSPHRPGGK